MAQILFAARPLDSGYQRGDPIVAVPDDHQWGSEEGLPNFAVVKITGLDHEVAQARVVEPLYQDALLGDPEFDSPDPADRRVLRHRRRLRLIWQDLPTFVQDQLRDTGYFETDLATARLYVRKLRWSRTQNQIEETPEAAI